MPLADDCSSNFLALIVPGVQPSAQQEHGVIEVSASESNKGQTYSVFDSGQFTQMALLLYLLHSHTTVLHKPDSPLSQS